MSFKIIALHWLQLKQHTGNNPISLQVFLMLYELAIFIVCYTFILIFLLLATYLA